MTTQQQMTCLSDMRNFIKNPERFQSVKEIVEAFEKIHKPNFCDASSEVKKYIETLYLELKNKITKMHGGKRNKKSRKTRKNQKGGVMDSGPFLAGVAICVFMVAFGFMSSVNMNLGGDDRARERSENRYGDAPRKIEDKWVSPRQYGRNENENNDS